MQGFGLPGWHEPSPEERLQRVEGLLHELGTALEAHMAEAKSHYGVLRRDLDASGAGRGMARELHDLRARVAALEAQVGGGAPFKTRSSDSLGMGSDFALVGWRPEAAPMWGSQVGGMGGNGKGGQLDLRSNSFDEEFGSLANLVSLEPSIWDCALLIVLHQGCSPLNSPRQVWWLGRFNIILLWTLLFFNITVQFFLIVAVNSMAGTNPLADAKASMRDEQLMVGHAFKEMDPGTMMTKAQRRCSNVELDSVAHVVNDISTYLQLGADQGLMNLPGNAICFLAMLFWVVEMTVELRRTADLMIVVLSLPHSFETVVEEIGTCHIVKGVTWWHKMLSFCVVLLPRLAVTLCLLWFGKRFLAGNVDISELILNACALEFVKNVDDLIFEAMATRTLILFTKRGKIERHVEHIEDPLEVNATDSDGEQESAAAVRKVRRGRMEVFNILIAICFIIFNAVEGYVDLIQPFVDSANQVYQNVCGMNTRFTYLFHPVTGTPVFSQADASHEMVSLRCFYAARYEMVRIRAGFEPHSFEHNETVTALLNGSHPSCRLPFGAEGSMACPERHIDFMIPTSKLRTNEYAKSSLCRDQDVFFAVLRETCLSENYYEPSKEALAFFEEAKGCRDLVRSCHGTANHRLSFPWFTKLRRICPATCGICGGGQNEEDFA